MPSASDKVLEIQGLHFKYPGTERKVLNDINLSVATGEMVILLGGNGQGKSTLAKILQKRIIPTAGTLLFSGAIGRIN